METRPTDEGSERDDPFRDEVMRRIAALQEQVDELRAGPRLRPFPDQVLAGYRDLPTDMDEPLRWGFMGCWGRGGGRLEVDIHTTSVEEYLSNPDASDEKVAAFARAFSNPRSVKVCKLLFGRPEIPREQLLTECGLGPEELELAVAPLLAAHLVRWDGERLVRTSHNYILTLMGMARSSHDPEHQQRSWQK